MERGSTLTKREIATLACKLMAIYAFLQAIEAIALIVDVLYRLPAVVMVPAEFFYYIGLLLQPIGFVIAGSLLWKKAGVVGAWMVGHDLQDDQYERDVAPQQPTIHEIQAIAFATVGLWVLVNAIPDFVAGLSSSLFYSMADSPDSSYELYATQYVGVWLVDSLLRLGIGVWLLLGASGLVRLILRLRNVGLQPDE